MPLTDAQLAQHIRTIAMFFQCTTWIAPLPVELPVNEFLPAFEFDPEQGGLSTAGYRESVLFCRWLKKFPNHP